MGILDRLSPMPQASGMNLRSPAQWFFDAMGRRESSAGVEVSDRTALSLSAYYCGINMIAGTVASLPLSVYKTDGVMRDIWPAHPAHWLLHNEPNPEMTAMSMRQSMVFHAIHRGNAYAQIIWDSRNNPIELWLIPPDICVPRRDTEGKLWYQVTPWEGEVRYIKPEDMLHVPGLGYDGVVGYGIMQLARESIGLNAAQDQYAAKFFRNGGNISGTLETPNVLNDKQFERLNKEVVTKFQGMNNAHRIAIMENGMKFNPMNPTHVEAQLVEARRFTIEEWARWLLIPPHKLREMGRTTFSNIENQNIEWVVDSIRPWLVRFEQEYNRKLFRKQSVFYTKHSVEGLMRGDIASRFSAYATARQWGWMSANDVRELEDCNPLPDDTGDIYLVPSNMMSAEQMGVMADTAETADAAIPGDTADDASEDTSSEDPNQTDGAVPAQTARKIIRATAERVVRAEAKAFSSIGMACYEGVKAKIVEWMSIDEVIAQKYCTAAAQLTLIAAEQNISNAEVQTRKVELLLKIIGGKHG